MNNLTKNTHCTKKILETEQNVLLCTDNHEIMAGRQTLIFMSRHRDFRTVLPLQ